MRLHAGDIDLLTTLAAMPFLDRLELAGISGRSPAAVYQRLDRFDEAGLVEQVCHSSELITPTRRYCLNAQGVRRLASELELPAIELLRTLPISEQWRRLILERLDAAAVIYRLSDAASEFCFPLRFNWFRASPMDAELELSDGRRIALVRQGPTADRTGFAKRIRRLRQTPGYGAVLIICPDETRLRHARRLVAGPPAITFLALERDVALRDGDAAIWRAPTSPAWLSLREALSFAVPVSGRQPEPLLSRFTMPKTLDADPAEQPALLPATLTTADKRTLDLIADWNWIRPIHLAGLLGVGKRRMTQLLSRLHELGLLTRVTQAGEPRLALSDRGLAYLGRRDRTSVGIARKRWSVQPHRPDETLDWRQIPGIRSRQLLRNLEHTESVHWFQSMLMSQAREQLLQVRQLDPPHRASRYFRYQDRLRSIQPDAFVLLDGAEGERACFLEWERRAVRPATMAARLAPYLRYYATSRPIEDHGLRPNVLIVFEDELTATQFLRVAERAMAQAEVPVPLFISDRETLKDQGPMGRAWQSAERRFALSAL